MRNSREGFGTAVSRKTKAANDEFLGAILRQTPFFWTPGCHVAVFLGGNPDGRFCTRPYQQPTPCSPIGQQDRPLRSTVHRHPHQLPEVGGVGRGGDVDPFYKGGKKADQRRSTWLRLPVNQPGARTAAPASGWVSFSLALGKPALLESQRSIPHLPKRRGRKVSLLVHESRRVGISEN